MRRLNYADFHNATDVQINIHLDWQNTDGNFLNTVIQPRSVARIAGFDNNISARICHRSDGGTYQACPLNSRTARPGDYWVLKEDGGYEDVQRLPEARPSLQWLLRLNLNLPKFGWVIVAAEVIYELAYAYEVFKDGGDDGAMLDAINRQLKRIDEKLTEVINRIDDVMATLRALPKLIQNTVDQAFLSDSVALVRSATQQIQTLSDPRFIHQNVAPLEDQLSKLQDQVNRLVGTKGGADRVMLAVAAYSTYLSGAVALQREKKKQNPAYIVQSPWEAVLNSFVKGQFSDLLARADEQNKFYNENCQFPPFNGTFLKIGARYFVTAQRRAEDALPFPRPNIGDYQIFKSTQLPAGQIEYGFGVYRYRRPDDGFVMDPTWFDVQAPFQDDEEEAARRFKLIFSDQQEITLFHAFMTKLMTDRIALLTCFDEPKGVWS